jgi:hypothetical protein
MRKELEEKLNNHIEEEIKKQPIQLETEEVEPDVTDKAYVRQEITSEDKGIELFVKIGNNSKIGDDE